LDFVCQKSPEERGPYIPSPSINTLGNKFGDYRCQDEKLELEFVMTMMYVGNVVGFLGLTLVGDLMGRKRLMIGNLFVALLGLLITMFCVSLPMAAVGLFLVTCGIQNSFNVCFYFISETMSDHQREMYEVLIQLFYGLGVLINVLWYYAVGDWQLIFGIFYFIPLVVVIVGMVKFIKDTPMCLIMRYTAKKAHRAFRYIAKLNKNKFRVTVDEIAEIKVNY
jgi:MFS family permease